MHLIVKSLNILIPLAGIDCTEKFSMQLLHHTSRWLTESGGSYSRTWLNYCITRCNCRLSDTFATQHFC